MQLEAPEVSIDADVLDTLVVYAGKAHVGAAYCEAIQIMSAADRERALGVLRMLHDDYSPEQVAHIAKQLGADPSEVQKDQGGGSS